ncbi:MAG: hypothetical protein UE295_03545 [Acutalibacteraceae bacterium]|nr:hypothetical protein [Acutalibacteraceae bacterium]
MTDVSIKENIVKVQELIKQAPGNAGGAEMIIRYHKGLCKKQIQKTIIQNKMNLATTYQSIGGFWLL